MKRFFSTTYLVILVTFAFGQCPFGGSSLTFNTQEEVDDFILDYPNCTEVTQSVFISNSTDITSLYGLSNIVSIGGGLKIRGNEVLTNLEGLVNLESIGQGLLIEDNSSLINMVGIDSLVSVGEKVDIESNSALINMSGMNNLTSIGLGLEIADNASLQNLSGLNNLSDVSSIEVLGVLINIHDNPSLENLSGLSSMVYLDADMAIFNNESLTNLEGLENLIHVEGYFSLVDNPSLIDISALNSLVTINKSLNVVDCHSLVNLIGFDSLITIRQYLTIRGNNQLELIDGFGSLSSVLSVYLTSNERLESIGDFNSLAVIQSELLITSNNSLQLINGFANLDTIGFNLSVRYNASLTEINGFTNLSFIEGSLFLSGNPLIEDIGGLGNLNTINRSLAISETSLVDLDELEGLSFVGNGVIVEDNPNLSDCIIEVVCARLATGNAVISDNAPGCDTEEEVLQICQAESYYGFTYYDFNQNQQWDDFESALPAQRVQINAQNDVLFTNQNGRYLVLCEENQPYTFTWLEDPNWQLTTDSASYSTIFEPYAPDNVDNNFGLYPTFTSHEFSISTTSGQTRCNTEVNFDFDICSRSTFSETDVAIVVRYDELMTFVAANPEPHAVNTIDRTISWIYDTIHPWECLDYIITFDMPDVEAIGEFIEVNTQVFRDSMGMIAQAEEEIYTAEVVCSYDPNDKLVEPRGEQAENYTTKDEQLNYTVRFQNTGNIEAIDVTIRDTLDSDLDWASFSVVQASHPVQTILDQDGAIMFYFKDIYLPDSISNPLGSQGFIRYEINPIVGLPDYTVVENTAFIYFDQNPPIITNTTVNTLVDIIPTRINDLEKTSDLAIYPNPTYGQLYISLDDTLINRRLEWALHDATGQLVTHFNITAESILDLSELPIGLYTLVVREQPTGQLWATKRVLLMR